MTNDARVLHMTAFAAEPGGGNPAGVVPDASTLSEDRMQQIAAELGYAESAFVVEPAIGDDPRHVRMRYFSPGAEVPFCGHATIATAVLLAGERGAGEFLFETMVGPVTISTEETGDTVTASFTSVRPDQRDLADDIRATLLGLLGLDETDLDERLPLKESFAGNWHPIVAVRDQAVFDGFSFDPTAVRELMDAQLWTGAVPIVHALTDTFDQFEARSLFPVGRVTEDPATGSAAAALGAYLRAIGAITPPAHVTIHQGRHVGRPSILQVDIPAEGGITVTGTASVLD
ncbi:phenazine biosynthesis protein PhzF [Microbacterium mangrovi]|uniref:Phenazine biosynthesis protein PhzF n=1 Tax=Microbacterium mangrovi TaxID=1348253 RepID=A0A0B2A620_9MICO|nr:PhzF family phenazine biosynthesis protein [Microbacterium mangrovi]KHK98954.1 phenazine biosynthesis protein PhzF [Microbacterium mangrovi]